MTITNPVAVYSDPCHPTDGFYPGPVDTVDGFVTALTEQQGWAEVTAPSDISVDGYVGKAFQRTAPADMSGCTTEDGGTDSVFTGRWENAIFPSWETADGINAATHRARSRPCGSSTSTARSSSSARHRGRGHRGRLTPVSPTRCSTRSASIGGDRVQSSWRHVAFVIVAVALAMACDEGDSSTSAVPAAATSVTSASTTPQVVPTTVASPVAETSPATSDAETTVEIAAVSFAGAWVDVTSGAIGVTGDWTNKVELADVNADAPFVLFANGGNYDSPEHLCSAESS